MFILHLFRGNRYHILFALGSLLLKSPKGSFSAVVEWTFIHMMRAGNQLSGRKENSYASAFPSMPVYFWNDSNDLKYKDAYFQPFLVFGITVILYAYLNREVLKFMAGVIQHLTRRSANRNIGDI